MKHSLWVLGEALMDCVAQPDGSLRPLLGGSPFNLACAAALQQIDVGYLSPFSTDLFGQALAKRLAQSGAKALSKPSSKPTSLAVVQIDNGQPSYGFYRDGIADRDYQAEHVVSLLKKHEPGVLHTGSLMAMPPESQKVLHVIQFAKALGWTISVDVNLRPRVADDLPAYLASVQRMASLADWLKASDEDMQVLGWHGVNWGNTQALAAQWQAMGCQRVALTFGELGASLHIGSTYVQATAPTVQVADTVGAGDVFWASCLADWIQHDTLKNDALALQNRESTLQRALRAAAINCERVGCQPPDVNEIEEKNNAK